MISRVLGDLRNRRKVMMVIVISTLTSSIAETRCDKIIYRKFIGRQLLASVVVVPGSEYVHSALVPKAEYENQSTCIACFSYHNP